MHTVTIDGNTQQFETLREAANCWSLSVIAGVWCEYKYTAPGKYFTVVYDPKEIWNEEVFIFADGW